MVKLVAPQDSYLRGAFPRLPPRAMFSHPPAPHTSPLARHAIRPRRRLRHLVVLALLAAALPAQQPAPNAAAAIAAPRYDRNTYEHTSADIPMRDGLTLHVEIFAPKGAIEPLPFLLERTPYGVAGFGERLKGGYSDLADEGYIFVFQDIRGRYRSQGNFVMQRPPRPVDCAGAGDRRRDGHARHDRVDARAPPATTTAASACSACATTAGRRRWGCSAGIPRCAP